MSAGFAAGRIPSATAWYVSRPEGLPLYLYATPPMGAIWPDERDSSTGRTTVAGHTAWYVEGRGEHGGPEAGSEMVVDAGACIVRIIVADRQQITRAELDTFVAGMTIGDCADPAGWAPPMR